MAIIAIAAYKLARTTNKQDPVLWGIAAIVCTATVLSGAEIRPLRSSRRRTCSSSAGRLFRRFEKHPRLQGFVKGATAAAAGAIAGAAIVIGRQTISGWLSAAIAAVALALLLQRWAKVPEPAFVVLAAGAGLALH